MDDRIAREMLKLYPPPAVGRAVRDPGFGGWDISEASRRLYARSPDAFLIAAIMDKQMPESRVYEIPLQLKRRMGHLDVRKIARMKKEALAGYLGPGRHGKALHRFYRTTAEQLIFDCGILVDRYGGSAKNLWEGDPRAGAVIERLMQFKGVSHKIAHMFTRQLIMCYGVELEGWDEIDVAVDRHVARVFLRTGLVKSARGRRHYSASELREPIVRRARELYPAYPAALDAPALAIGRRWCTERVARCHGEDGVGPCPLSEVCTKRKRHYKIV